MLQMNFVMDITSPDHLAFNPEDRSKYIPVFNNRHPVPCYLPFQDGTSMTVFDKKPYLEPDMLLLACMWQLS